MGFIRATPEPDLDGYAAVPLPCGHLDEVLSPDQVAAGRSYVSRCPVCHGAYSAVLIHEDDLPAEYRKLRPGGLTVIIVDLPGPPPEES